MKFSEHYERFREKRPDRRDITIRMCERIKAEPMEEQDQDKGRRAYWGYVPEQGRYLRVIIEPDGEEITTAHWDRGFKRKVKRQVEEG